MKKSITILTLALGTFLFIAGGTIFILDKEEVETGRELASESERLKILDDIPLIPEYEKKRKNEKKIYYKLAKIFKKIADESKNADGSLNRGTHAKGQCFEGVTRMETDKNTSSETLDRIKKGFFRFAGDFKTHIRFANAKGQVNDDRVADVRAMSFAIETEGLSVDEVGGSRLDFMMNSSPMFAVRNIKEFHELMKAARIAQGDRSYITQLNLSYLDNTYKAKKLLDKYEREDVLSYATENYWSNVPYTHLNENDEKKEIVKYKITPCAGAKVLEESNTDLASDYLQADIQDRALSMGVCFKLQVQLFDKEKLVKIFKKDKYKKWTNADWIENGGMLWDEKELPFHTVAKITIPAGSRSVSCDDKYINTRLHSSPAHRPIGSLARGRVVVEEISRMRRQEEQE